MIVNDLPGNDAPDDLNPYPVHTDRATLGLQSFLLKRIKQRTSITFDDWMQQCLYHPTWGYYNRGNLNVGRGGDFFTSVSVGNCFGMLLAHRIHHYVSNSAAESTLTIIELGANTGQLACDILNTLKQQFPETYQRIRYHICEHLPSMQKLQQQNLHEHAAILQQSKCLKEITIPFDKAILLSNELIDAFPVKSLIKQDKQWLERSVEVNQGAFRWVTHPPESDELLDFCAKLPQNLDNGYLTEFRPGLAEFCSECSRIMLSGMIITIDYGHIRPDYYTPERRAGTLRTFHQHKAGDDPLLLPGEQDITSHVDFSQLAEHFQAAQLTPSYFNTQSRYLIEYAKNWMLTLESSSQPPCSKLIRQFQTLTHPAMMGRQFHVLECIKEAAACPKTLQKLALGD